MKLKFDKPRGQRVMRRFHGIEIVDGNDCWWDETNKKWDDISNIRGSCSNFFPCKTVRAFKRHIRKHSSYMGKGRFRLASMYVGYDVCA